MSGLWARLTLLHRGRRMAGMALARAWKQMSWFYYQYLLVTALYMLEPWERTVFSILCVLAWPGRGRVRAPGWVGVSWGPSGDPGLGRNSPAQGGGILISACSREDDVSLGASWPRFGRACLSFSLLV